MDNIKKLIIVFVIIALILSIVILNLLKQEINTNEIESVTEGEVNYKDFEGEYNTNVNLQKVSTRKRYFSVKQIIDDFVSYLSDSKIGADALEQILGQEYKTEFNITKQNITTNLSKYASAEIYIEDMYELEKSDVISLILINGRTKKGNVAFKTIIKLDYENRTYAIYPEEYMSKHGYNNFEKVTEINKINLNNIPEKSYNTFAYKEISDLEMCEYYLQDYVYNVTANIEDAYNLLDKDYREVRFGNLEGYKAYVNSNLDKIKNAKLSEYTILRYPSYRQYVCIDTNGNHYLFRETTIMEYSLLLDTYSIVLPEFSEKYNMAKDSEKVALNINNFVQAINDKNYTYAYNALNQSFKSSKFTTQAGFVSFVQSNLFENNKLELVEYLIEGSTHIYKVEITDGGTRSVKMTVVMELGTGTNFAMSFSIN